MTSTTSKIAADSAVNQVGRPLDVDFDIIRDPVHRLADPGGRGQVVDDAGPIQRPAQRVAVPHIAQDVLRARVGVRRPATLLGQRAVHLRFQVVEDSHGMAPRHQRVDQVRADKARAAGDQDGFPYVPV